MPQSAAPSPSDDIEAPTVVLPRPAINLALRVLQLMAGAQYLELRVVRIDGTMYLLAPGGKLERLG